ncbi:MAG: 5'-methylthioadenosine/adenosylhomocysteine nucleosidase [Comamonas sp.]|uniref:5'-methylthioadenosine/adenosylhomocysteine nucleosidase n=1 Tax=Comamonas sp. TaxID=34028 RepID=UPI002825C5CB|nr:5'-methylthioadenosine/adenosylhomocysteine nucleosidase [Comamonas sp.]MDR0213401.1 5'-methylthioadenosine/adenosylhomocysteine nucleosidase [Comamonas sp.]
MTIAILSALAEEQHGLVDAMEDMQSQRHAGRDFWLGRLHGHEVVCALSGIGKVAAATTTAALIERFGVRAIVFTGVAGGIGQGVNVGDVVIARQFLQHDMDASPIFPRWELPGYGCTTLACDGAMTDRLVQAAASAVQAGIVASHASARVHEGLIASGDQFVSSRQASDRLRTELQAASHHVLAVEMEGAAVAQTCFDYCVPFAAMRTISDRADDSAHVDFSEFVRTVASRYAQLVVSDFLRQLR